MSETSHAQTRMPTAAMEEAIKLQGDKVRELKAAKAPADEIKAAVDKLLALKAEAGVGYTHESLLTVASTVTICTFSFEIALDSTFSLLHSPQLWVQ